MAGKHKGPLRIAIEDWFQTFELGDVLGRWFGGAADVHEKQIVSAHADFLSILQEVDELPSVLKAFSRGETEGLQGGVLTAAGFASNMGQAAAGGLMQPIVNKLNYAMEREISHSALPDIQTLITMDRFQSMDPEYFLGVAQSLGWTEDLIERWDEMTLQRVGPGDLIQLWRRKEISQTRLFAELTRRGWAEEDMNFLLTLTEVIPGVGDLITMTVREAFNDEVAGRFGYDEDFPTEVVPYTQAHGLTEEWVRRYWRMHWNLPSVGQGFEMLHRLRPGTTDIPFTPEDLELLLKAQDIPSYWRSRLTQVSYNPLTRVDVRRMHDMGILGREDVKASYLDIGYNEQNAEYMTQFTEQFNADDKKSLSRAAVIKAYKKGILTENEALDILVSAGHKPEEAQFYVDLATFDILEEQTDLETDLVHDQYLSGQIDKSKAHAELISLQIPTSQVDYLIRRWELELAKKQRLPTEGELEKFYKLGYITEGDYREGLIERQYKPESIDWYIQEADQAIAEAAAKQEKEALEAREKLEDEVLASEYRIARQALDVQVAQERANIAELKLLTHSIEDPDKLKQIKERMDALKLRIRNLQVQKADLELSEDIQTQEEI